MIEILEPETSTLPPVAVVLGQLCTASSAVAGGRVVPALNFHGVGVSALGPPEPVAPQ